MTATATDDAYGGVFGAFPFALRASDSLLFRSYVVVGGLAILFTSLLVVMGLVQLMGRTAAVAGGTFTFSRAFFVLVGLLAVAPMLAPVLLVARRRRRGTVASARHDAAFGLLGYLAVLSLYLGLVVSAPDPLEPDGGGVVGLLNALPDAAGGALPAATVVLLYAVVRATRP